MNFRPLTGLSLLLGVVIGLISCQTSQKATQATLPANLPVVLKKAIEAHGGYDTWKKMRTWAFSVERDGQLQRHTTDLATRQVRIESEPYTIGFDGQDVWITPDKAAFGQGSPRFYHNLYWYFHAFPFVMTDPGINYETVSPKTIDGVAYPGVKITYNAGVGDAPDDEYIAYFHPQSHRMHLLLYTVTYFQGQPGDKYNALVYDEWKRVNGLLIPKTLKGYKYDGATLGDQRYTRTFEDLTVERKAPDASLFARPANAEIDALPARS